MYRDQREPLRAATTVQEDEWTSAEATGIKLARWSFIAAVVSIVIACVTLAQAYYGWKPDSGTNSSASGASSTSAPPVVPYVIDSHPYSQPYAPTPRYRPAAPTGTDDGT
jgi:hypothetical protein